MNESKIIKINEIYNRGLEGGEVGIWEWDIEENNVFLSEYCYRVTGYVNERFNNFYECLEKFVVLEDRDRAIKDLELFISGNTTFYRSEVKILAKDGTVKWILIKGKYSENIRENRKLISGSITDISIKKELENQIKNLVYYDLVTGLPNRNLLMQKLNITIKKCRERKRKAAVICMDIDNFNSINDTFGHEHGDTLLKIFSQVLLACEKENVNVFCITGDEFMVVLDELSSYDEVENFCNDILNYCNRPFELIDIQVYISVSIGVVCLPKDSLDVNDIYRYVDLSMHQSKIKGNKMVTFFDKSLLNTYSRKLLIEQELKNAIKNRELYIVYQPQVDVLQYKIIGFEALLRWDNRKLGNISPSEFIPIAEKCGIIIEIGRWVINTVCDKILELLKKDYQLQSISVNVSPVQLKHSQFIVELEDILNKKRIPPSMLEIEVTEGKLIELQKNDIEIFNKIVEKGIKIAIDDFGTGYSSLNYLTTLPINTLKIDKSFVDDIEKEKNMAVIDCILNLSKALKYKVVAEGVETEVQMNKLLNAGSSIIQGYYFSQAIKEEEIELLLLHTNKQRN